MLHIHQGYAHYARERVRVPNDLCAGPGFASTAVYFESLAQKETRDPDRRQRLLEVARFYRSLAGIIPGMPQGYKNNKGAVLAVTRAQRWHWRAEECRTLADCFTDPISRRQLRELAQDYERMAVAAG